MNKTLFFTPGPSQLYPTVEKHIRTAMRKNIASISHRSSVFQEIYKQATDNIRKLLRVPADYHVFYLSSGTEAMERIIENCVEKTSFHLVDGAFSNTFQNIAVSLGKTAITYKVEDGDYIDCLKINVPKKAEIICFTHNETSTGVALPLECLSHARKRYPNMLVALDIVSSVPYPSFDMTLVDCTFFSVQKGFGLPSGLGVLIVSPRAIKKSLNLQKKGRSVGSYHRFERLLKYSLKNQTPETPNVLDLYLLAKVSSDFLKRGISSIRKDTDKKASLLYSFFEKRDGFETFARQSVRSTTVIIIRVKGGSAELISHLKKKNIVVGAGYGPYKKEHMRIANFPAHSEPDIKRLLREIRSYAS